MKDFRGILVQREMIMTQNLKNYDAWKLATPDYYDQPLNADVAFEDYQFTFEDTVYSFDGIAEVRNGEIVCIEYKSIAVADDLGNWSLVDNSEWFGDVTEAFDGNVEFENYIIEMAL